MNEFTHLRILMGIILGLSVTHILKGLVKPIQHPRKGPKSYWIRILWAVYIFLMLIHFWWWEFNLIHVHQWNFLDYCLLILYALNFFLLCALLFPEDVSEYKDYRDYFFCRKNWFFSVLAIGFIIDIWDTMLKGADYIHKLGYEYPIRNTVLIILCVVAIKVKSERFHAVLVILFILYELSWIYRLYYFL